MWGGRGRGCDKVFEREEVETLLQEHVGGEENGLLQEHERRRRRGAEWSGEGGREGEWPPSLGRTTVERRRCVPKTARPPREYPDQGTPREATSGEHQPGFLRVPPPLATHRAPRTRRGTPQCTAEAQPPLLGARLGAVQTAGGVPCRLPHMDSRAAMRRDIPVPCSPTQSRRRRGVLRSSGISRVSQPWRGETRGVRGSPHAGLSEQHRPMQLFCCAGCGHRQAPRKGSCGNPGRSLSCQ